MDVRGFARNLTAEYREEVLAVVRDLLRIPSRNMPPGGEEGNCQRYIASYLSRAGLPVDMYEPDTVPGLVDLPSYWPGRTYRDRPNISSRLAGLGGGRSLLLTGHIDTVAMGDYVWRHAPFGAEMGEGRLYGLGSIDMKAAMGAMLVLFKVLSEKRVRLNGALEYESVVDEEEGGVNATIAGRLRNGRIDGALIPEGTALQIYPAARGALITDFIFKSSKGTWLDVGKSGEKRADAVKQVGCFLSHLDELAEVRRTVPVHLLYESYPDPVPVEVTKVYAGGWGNQVPIAVPPEARLELIMQAMPGETREQVSKHLHDWLDSVMARYPDVFPAPPEERFRIRWMVPTAMDQKHALVKTLEDAVRDVTGRPADVLGAPFACDMFALHQIFDMPGVIFGPTGANAHAADEYVETESLLQFFEALSVFVLNWCGVEE